MRRPLLLLPVILLLAGCSSVLEVGIERTPTPDVAPAATMTAMASEISRLATRVAAQVTPTPAPLSLGYLAYVQGGDIWIKTLPSGTPQRLTTDGHNNRPRWSPSGQWLAFRKERQVMVEQECDIPRLRPQICFESVPCCKCKSGWSRRMAIARTC